MMTPWHEQLETWWNQQLTDHSIALSILKFKRNNCFIALSAETSMKQNHSIALSTGTPIKQTITPLHCLLKLQWSRQSLHCTVCWNFNEADNHSIALSAETSMKQTITPLHCLLKLQWSRQSLHCTAYSDFSVQPYLEVVTTSLWHGDVDYCRACEQHCFLQFVHIHIHLSAHPELWKTIAIGLVQAHFGGRELCMSLTWSATCGLHTVCQTQVSC